MTAYVVYLGEVTDPRRYEQYKLQAAAAIAAAGGRYIVRGGEVTALEGEPPASRTVILEFPDRAAAVAWYESEQYHEARRLRQGAAVARMYVVDGVDQS